MDENGTLSREEFNLFNWRTSGEQVGGHVVRRSGGHVFRRSGGQEVRRSGGQEVRRIGGQEDMRS